MRKIISEADVEENVLAILKSLGYEIIRGDNEDYLPGGRSALREGYKDVVLVEREFLGCIRSKTGACVCGAVCKLC